MSHGVWESAQVRLVRTYDWVSRLDTVDNPDSLFPKWSADPDDPDSYNFDATDSWIRQVQAIGADILFTIASSVPSNKRPASDLATYEQVVENIVRHYEDGWGGGGFTHAVTRWEFGDQPDFGTLHFDGTPDEFYEMYAAVARAVKRVSPQLQFGGPCPAFGLDEGPYREGFLDFVKRNKLPLDFFTWMWFTDDSRDPLDFRTVATQLRGILDAHGFETTELLLAYWNMTGIPNAKFTDADAAAFQAAAAVYMQDSPIDRAILFRVDTGTDLHYKIHDPAGIFDADGSENARTASYRLVGQTLAARERLDVQGGDDNGFAVLAGRTESNDTVGSWSRTTRFPMPISRRATAMSSNFRCRSIPSRRTCRSPFPPDELMPRVLNWRATPSKSTTFPGAPALTKSCATESMTRTTVRSSARAQVTGAQPQFKVGWRRQRLN